MSLLTPYDIVLKLIHKLKTSNTMGLISDYFHNGTPLLYECVYFIICINKHSCTPCKAYQLSSVSII